MSQHSHFDPSQPLATVFGIISAVLAKYFIPSPETSKLIIREIIITAPAAVIGTIIGYAVGIVLRRLHKKYFPKL